MPYSAYFSYTHLNLSVDEVSRRYRSLIGQCSECVPVDTFTVDSLRRLSWHALLGEYLSIAQNIIKELEHSGAVIIQGDAELSVAPVIAALVQLSVDPRYRTIWGFCTLVDQTWIAHAFPFASSSDSYAPYAVFYCFFNCVWLLTRRYPTAFEFNEDLLVIFLDNVHSKRFTTFLFDSEKERSEIARGGASLFLHLADKTVREKFVNETFVPDSSLLAPASVNVMPWTSMLLRYNPWYRRALLATSEALSLAADEAKKHGNFTLADDLAFTLPSKLIDIDLTVLTVTHTQLYYAPLWTSAHSSLKELILENNKLAYVPPGIDKLIHLELLSLAQNCISFIDESLFAMSNLKSLVLSGNEVHLQQCPCVLTP